VSLLLGVALLGSAVQAGNIGSAVAHLDPGVDRPRHQEVPLEGSAAEVALGPALLDEAALEPLPAESAAGEPAFAPPASAELAPAARPPQPIKHIIQPGESLLDIAERFGVDVPTLLSANELDDPDLVPVGFELTVLPVRGVLYDVAEGDTLNVIASRYGIETGEILQANSLESSDLIRAGQPLILPGAKPLYVRTTPQEQVVEAAAPQAPSRSSGLASQVVAATRPAPLDLVWPTSGPITTRFGQVGWTSPRGHAGVDIAAPWGAPVRAAAAGRVAVATRAGGAYGILVVIDHGDGLRTVYAHLSQLNVDPGESVERGELIGLVGSTGFSTGPHLHFEVLRDGALRDPIAYLP
jgi:murein DD-endopeptidase MepM/ murein hydrolase activator NlpD